MSLSISPEMGIAPNTTIIPFRQIDPKEIARRTGGILKFIEKERLPYEIVYPHLSSSLSGFEATLRSRSKDVAPWISERDDGLDAYAHMATYTMRLHNTAIVMRPNYVTFVAPINEHNPAVVYALFGKEIATPMVMMQERLSTADPDILRAATLAEQWKSLLQTDISERSRLANEKIWSSINASRQQNPLV